MWVGVFGCVSGENCVGEDIEGGGGVLMGRGGGRSLRLLWRVWEFMLGNERGGGGRDVVCVRGGKGGGVGGLGFMWWGGGGRGGGWGLLFGVGGGVWGGGLVGWDVWGGKFWRVFFVAIQVWKKPTSLILCVFVWCLGLCGGGGGVFFCFVFGGFWGVGARGWGGGGVWGEGGWGGVVGCVAGEVFFLFGVGGGRGCGAALVGGVWWVGVVLGGWRVGGGEVGNGFGVKGGGRWGWVWFCAVVFLGFFLWLFGGCLVFVLSLWG